MIERRSMQRRSDDDLSHLDRKIVELNETLVHCIERIEKQNTLFQTYTAIQDKTNTIMERRLNIAEEALKTLDKHISNKENFFTGIGFGIKTIMVTITALIAAGWALFEKFYK
jgi:Asp-tRNA(Asn)/Glu-tRNA(Gln) amidotransferase A subunit family amidase